jgi:hypothetical protein
MGRESKFWRRAASVGYQYGSRYPKLTSPEFAKGMAAAEPSRKTQQATGTRSTVEAIDRKE